MHLFAQIDRRQHCQHFTSHFAGASLGDSSAYPKTVSEKGTVRLGRKPRLGEGDRHPVCWGSADYAKMSQSPAGFSTEQDSPILLRGLRKIGTVPDGFRIGS